MEKSSLSISIFSFAVFWDYFQKFSLISFYVNLFLKQPAPPTQMKMSKKVCLSSFQYFIFPLTHSLTPFIFSVFFFPSFLTLTLSVYLSSFSLCLKIFPLFSLSLYPSTSLYLFIFLPHYRSFFLPLFNFTIFFSFFLIPFLPPSLLPSIFLFLPLSPSLSHICLELQQFSEKSWICLDFKMSHYLFCMVFTYMIF